MPITRSANSWLATTPATGTDVTADTAADAPFLTVVLRTQGDRPHTLRDALLCLLGQTVQDFEAVLVAHATSTEGRADVERAVADLPLSLRQRIRVIDVPEGGRATPLNAAFEVVRGRYVAVLDDDDLVLAHWVAAFAEAADGAPGEVLRSVCVEQSIAPASCAGQPFAQVVGPMSMRYPATFDLVDHLERNHTPFMAYAFPRELFTERGQRFDDRLDICEDWDFALRAALLVGVCSVPQVTAVYRRWNSGTASATLHSEQEWRLTERAIIAKIDKEPHQFPAGTITAILRARERVAADIVALRERNAELEEQGQRMERSASWRLTAPLRAVRNWPGRRH